MIYKFKKYLAILTIVALLFGQNATFVLAQEAPTAPSEPAAPTAPAAPEAPNTPTAPTAPTAPSEPAAPTAPAAPENPTTPNTPTAPTAPASPSAPEQPTQEIGEQAQNPSTEIPVTENNNHQGATSDGNVGNTAITTGDANNDSDITTQGNTNASTNNTCCAGSASVENSGNGAGSTNNGSASVTNNNDTNQSNSASVANDLNQTTVTGQNSTSFNVGDSSIKTGDANTTGTVITAVNTNVDGVMISEFNIADDHVGDIVLNFGAGCIQGCNGETVNAENTGNGAGSDNAASSSATNNNTTDQTNNANVGSNLTLQADSGNNDAGFNTGGDSDIVTGDANVAANSLTFANNNIAGNIIFGVVNIFGDLIGDIILTEEAMNAACGGSCGESAIASNTGNGSGSANTSLASNNTNNTTFQSNDADINNTLILDAQTGNNDASFNTGGNSTIQTGDANVQANVLNVANSNIDGGNMWLVIINEAGRWIGRIFGAPEGSNMAGSEGTEFVVDPETGAVTASNNGNGANSTNQSNTQTTTNNTTNQTNNATINNQLNLSANTGGNSTSFNTNGNSNIKTGDATIVANIVNFVNNNIVGNGKLVVTVVNVFGSWLGDFVAPGQHKPTKALAQVEPTHDNIPTPSPVGNGGGATNKTANTTPTPAPTNAPSTGFVAGVSQSIQNTITNILQPQTNNTETNRTTGTKNNNGAAVTIKVAGISDTNNRLLANAAPENNFSAKTKGIKINLAWLILIMPIFGALIVKKYLLKYIKK